MITAGENMEMPMTMITTITMPTNCPRWEYGIPRKGDKYITSYGVAVEASGENETYRLYLQPKLLIRAYEVRMDGGKAVIL